MYFDTDSFDFTNLKDINTFDESDVNGYSNKDYSKAPDYKEKEAPRNEYDDAFANDEEDEPDFIDFNDDVSDLTAGTNEDKIRANNYFNALDDDAVLEVGGVELTKAEIKDLYTEKQRIDNEKAVVTDAYKSFDEGNKWIVEQITRNQASIDNNVELCNRRLQNPNLSAYEKGQVYEELQRMQVEQNKLNQRTNEIMRIRDEQEKQAINHRIVQSDAIMTQNYPQWGKWKATIINNLKSNGFDPVELQKVWSPALATALLESHLYRHNKKVLNKEAVEGVKKSVNARSISSTNKSRLSTEEVTKKKQALSSMGSSRQSNVEAFAYLKD
jgi:hypothetical protein